jgi:hypothetical protein
MRNIGAMPSVPCKTPPTPLGSTAKAGSRWGAMTYGTRALRSPSRGLDDANVASLGDKLAAGLKA